MPESRDAEPPQGSWPDLIHRVENQERRARDFLSGDYGPPRDHLPEPVPAVAKIAAWHLLDAENRKVSERKLFALVDAVVSVLTHGGREETARLAFETVVRPAVALAAVRILTGEER